MDTHYDVLIIGSGAGGGTLARCLAEAGRKVLVLERGGWLPREPQNWDSAEVFQANRYVSPDIWKDKNGNHFQPGSHYFVGGATKMYFTDGFDMNSPVVYNRNSARFQASMQH